MTYNPTSVWSSDYQSFDFFSVFLERHVLNPDRMDLSFTPLEYLEQIIACKQSEEGQGYLNLLMMLFTEYYQEKVTGNSKIRLPEEKYELMGKQFLLLCDCELLRRKREIAFIKEEYLFDPNVKTEFYINPLSAVSHMKTRFEEFSIILKEFSL